MYVGFLQMTGPIHIHTYTYTIHREANIKELLLFEMSHGIGGEI